MAWDKKKYLKWWKTEMYDQLKDLMNFDEIKQRALIEIKDIFNIIFYNFTSWTCNEDWRVWRWRGVVFRIKIRCVIEDRSERKSWHSKPRKGSNPRNEPDVEGKKYYFKDRSCDYDFDERKVFRYFVCGNLRHFWTEWPRLKNKA